MEGNRWSPKLCARGGCLQGHLGKTGGWDPLIKIKDEAHAHWCAYDNKCSAFSEVRQPAGGNWTN